MKLLTLDIVENLANKLRGEWGVSESEPLHTKTILRKLNILALYRPLSDQSCGLSIKTKDGKCFMLINSNSTRGRQHFTIAHELYHLYVDEHPVPHFCSETGDKDPKEKIADLFASCLLMPKNGILMNIPDSEIVSRSVSMATVLRLEQLFGVSHQAMAYRLKRLKLISEDQLQTFLNMNIKEVTAQYGIDQTLYQSGNEGLVIGDYGSKARILYENDKISEGHYNELMNLITYGEN